MFDGGGPAIVGRDAEIDLLKSLVGRVAGGDGGVLWVLGEAGVGKTRLLAEAARHARESGLLVLTGRAVQGGGAYRPLAEALAAHLRADPVLDGAELRPYRAALARMLPGWGGEASLAGPDPALVLGEGLVRLLGALNGERGCVVALEDLHWADADTLAVLEYLASAVRGCPILIIGSARDEENPPLPLNRLANRPETHAIRLRPLASADVVRLAERCAGEALPDRVRRLVLDKSDGLPLLVEELVAGGLRGAVPPTLAGIVAERLAALAPEWRRVLQASAVLGGEPDWTLLAPVTGSAEDTVLDALREARPRLVVTEGDTLRWRHALTRDAVLATVTPPERVVFARRSAEALLVRNGPDDDVRAADLLVAAGERDRAAEIFLRLASDDLDRGALRDADALLDRAGATATPAPAVAVERVRLLTLLGRAGDALAEGTRVLDATTGDDHARLCVRLADAAISLRHWADADRLLHRAGRPDDPDTLVLAADAAFGPGDLPRAARIATAAIRRAEADGNHEACCRALVILGRCHLRSDIEAGRAAYERALRIAAEHGLRLRRIDALINLATVELFAHPLTPILAEAHELAVETGALAEVISTDLLHTEGVLIIDGPRAAEPYARAVAEDAGRLRLPAHQAVGEMLAAYGRAADGDGPGVRAMTTTATDRRDAPVEISALAPTAHGLLRLLDGDLTAACRLFDQGMARLRGHDQAAPVPLWGLWSLLRSVTADRDDEARAELSRSFVTLRNVNRGVLRYAEAVGAGRAGRAAEAAELMAAGDELLAEHHWWRRLCRTVAMHAAVAAGWGDPVAGLRADLTVFEETGEDRLARMCRTLLRHAGAPTRRGRGLASVPAPLRAVGITSRETDVLALLADGLTNREIAERLYLSPRTVDTHVASLLAKTGAADRTRLRTHWPGTTTHATRSPSVPTAHTGHRRPDLSPSTRG